MNGLDLIADLAVPTVVWLLMLVVGLELSPSDFRRVLRYPRAVVTATAGQILLLPLIAAALILVLEPPPHIVAGMVLVAASPGGAISNVYTLLAGAHVALSVTLTAVTTLAAMLTMPLLCSAGFSLFMRPQDVVPAPVLGMAMQLLLMLVFPIVLGMLLRRWHPRRVHRQKRALRRLSLLALSVLIALILYDQRELLHAASPDIAVAALLFSAGAMVTGWTLGWLAGLSAGERFTLLLEFTARNLAITALVGITVLDRADFVLFATLFFLAQVPLILGLIALRTTCRNLQRRVSSS
jgi:BASS family bile acid:Na+ symporter